MNLNKGMTEFLKEHLSEDGIPTALLYLLSVYHNLSVELPDDIIRKVNSLGILDKDYKTNTINWYIPLYDNQNIDSVWEWVNDYRKLFASKNKEREGNKKSCVQRMKVFFRENPEVRKQDVLQATEMYLRTVEPKYVKSAERFIYDGQGNFKVSHLLGWVEKLFDQRIKQKIDPNTKMMK